MRVPEVFREIGLGYLPTAMMYSVKRPDQTGYHEPVTGPIEFDSQGRPGNFQDIPQTEGWPVTSPGCDRIIRPSTASLDWQDVACQLMQQRHSTSANRRPQFPQGPSQVTPATVLVV